MSQDFDTEVMPVLTKLGCNAVACHGAAEGKGALRLSTLGIDPVADYTAIAKPSTRSLINRATVYASLLLANPSGQIDSDCPTVIQPNGAGYRVLLTWIEQGASRTGDRRLTTYRLDPSRAIVPKVGLVTKFRAFAKFNDEPERDVTSWTSFTPTGSADVIIDESHAHFLSVQADRPGRHVIITRFLDQVASIEIIVPFGDVPIDMTILPRANFIDDEIIETLSQLQIPTSERAEASSLLRRVYLDLIGRLPSTIELDRFEANTSNHAFEKEVDRLLASDAFVDYWTLKFSRWLRVHAIPGDSQATETYVNWIHHSIQSGIGIDSFGRQLLTATGDSQRVGPANFARMVANAQEHADLVSEFFLGAKMRCASCHTHPVAQWTQDDFHGLAAIFSKVERDRRVQIDLQKTIINPRTGQNAKPKLPGDSFVIDSADARVDFADWLLSDGNQYFARAMVNRLWQTMFGRGLVEPVADLRDTNPATHPKLHDRLADDFVSHHYSLRHTLRLIALSETYARSSVAVTGNELDTQYYSRSYCRPLEPEVLADAIADVTGVSNQFARMRQRDKAITLYDPAIAESELKNMGSCCTADSTPAAPLHARDHSLKPFLINSEFIHSKLSNPSSFVHRSIQAGLSDREIISQLYRRAFSRQPAPEQEQPWSDKVPLVKDAKRASPLEDFLWTLLNSYRFTNNH